MTIALGDPLRDGREEQLVAPRMLRSSFRNRDGGRSTKHDRKVADER